MAIKHSTTVTDGVDVYNKAKWEAAHTIEDNSILDAALSAAAQAAITASHAAASVAGAPLTLAGQAITFNKSASHFDLSGNDLILKAAGHVHPTYGASAINRLAGITPTQADWDTPPTDLANSTDGNFATVTGTGQDAVATYGASGDITWDMGAVYNVLIQAKILLGNTLVAGNWTYADLWIDGKRVNRWLAFGFWQANATDTLWISGCGRGQTIAIKATGGADMTVKLAVYEIQALDLGV
jgi:hypothetical protein